MIVHILTSTDEICSLIHFYWGAALALLRLLLPSFLLLLACLKIKAEFIPRLLFIIPFALISMQRSTSKRNSKPAGGAVETARSN